MEVSKTLQPGDMGTKRFLEKYGDHLVCVRYRIDKEQKKRYTTIELVIDEKPYINQKPVVIVWVKILYSETRLRQKVGAIGARWLPDNKAWEMEYECAKKLGLIKRIIKRKVK